VIAPGNPDESLLIEAVQYMGLEMPPKEKLPDELIEELVKWVEMGAPDPRTGKAARARNKIDLTEARKFWRFNVRRPHLRRKCATPCGRSPTSTASSRRSAKRNISSRPRTPTARRSSAA